MTSRKGVLTAGTWCADHNKVVEFWPLENEVVEILSEDVKGGGSGCNLAIDLKRLDPSIPVETIGVIGNDEDGRILLAEADAYGIERSRLHVVEGLRTNYTDAYTSNKTGRRTHIYLQGASAELNPDHFDFSKTNARFLHLGLPGIHRQMDRAWGSDENGWVTVLKAAQAVGIETNMELCSIAPEKLAKIVRPCLPHLDYLIINDFEMAAISGNPTVAAEAANVDRVILSAQAVLAMGSMRLLVAHFPDGAVVLTRGEGPKFIASVDVPPDKVIGANGAGDAFAAGVIYGLHENWLIEDAVRLGHAAAAVSLRSLGTTDAVLPVAESLAMANKWGWRKLD
ncbi:MAG: carbohydrate kinase family protein [Pseudotabrizicola sp.]|uniref:carbohydrate kinase family protein n=1 Tax=Pseudotabrizicola sp. TaxID=2939647 RepID=UPI002731BDDE|nr:carbohydrate kinase family protein [Pseudotabrizicola sp.]MDP2081170.1 carbohydrate kinase family protein [Pseudotabrizicola sp.]MDZ7573101.1 carbohydrate kinase family protein [Pseudotabrizicola sp.]